MQVAHLVLFHEAAQFPVFGVDLLLKSDQIVDDLRRILDIRGENV